MPQLSFSIGVSILLSVVAFIMNTISLSFKEPDFIASALIAWVVLGVALIAGSFEKPR